MTVIKPRTPDVDTKELTIFLAGTIDNGSSRNWQKEFETRLETINPNFVIFNPRRDNWETNPDKKELRYQIQWELSHLDKSDVIIMNILGNSQSPISLLELGLYVTQQKGMFVICPKSFYRYDNVFLTCAKYKIPLFETEEEFFKAFKEIMKQLH